MRKTLSIAMLLMANVILLAHAVVPHHHHDRVAVAIVHPWENEAAHHHPHDADGHHHHNHHHNHHEHNSDVHHHHPHDADGHHHESTEDCFLSEVMAEALPRDTFDEIEASLNTAWLLSHSLPDCEALLAEAIAAVDALQYLRHPFRQRPYLTSLYIAFVEGQFGFRAPPFC